MRVKLVHDFRSLIAALALTVSSTSFALPQYRLTDLGSTGNTSAAVAVNQSGQVAGWSYGADANHIFLFHPSTGMQTFEQYNGATTLAAGLSDAGHITGSIYQFRARPFLHTQAGGYRALGTLPDTIDSFGYAVNDRGLVVGESLNINGRSQAFVHGDTMRPLGTLGGNQSSARGINNLDQITGSSNFVVDGASSPFIYSEATGMVALSEDIGSGFGINDKGQVTGYVTVENDWHAFVYTPGQELSLVAHNSIGQAINNLGQVVGANYTTGGPEGSSLAFYYSPETGEVANLNDLLAGSGADGWVLERANGINDKGWIVGSGEVNGETHAFLLTPVPEPGAYALMSAGIIGVGFMAWRRRKQLAAETGRRAPRMRHP